MRDAHGSSVARPASGRDPLLDPEGPSSRGFERIMVGRVQILARAEAASWSREAVVAYGSLYQAALDSACRTLRGRGPVPILPNPQGIEPPWAVRRYYRGGLMRAFGDRFLRAGRPRSFLELENSARIAEMGFATPRVVAAAVYPSGVLYRADLVTELVPHARTLADVLFGIDDPSSGNNTGEARRGEGREARRDDGREARRDDGPEARRDARREALACTGNLITRLSKAGVHHPDLNAENVLIAQEAQQVHAILIDLDRCRVAETSDPVDAGRLRRRLARSIRKLDRARPRSHGDGEGHLSTEELNHLLNELEAL